MDGYRFSTDVTVRFAETDAQGIAHHASYLVWFEVARIDYLARFDGGYQGIRDSGMEALTIEAAVRYLAPSRFGDRLRVHTRVADARGARFRFEYAVESVAEGSVVAEGHTGHAWVNATTFRPTRMPAWLVEAIASAEAEPPSAQSSSRP